MTPRRRRRLYEKRSPSEPEKGTYEKNITQIVDKAQAAGMKVVILTATVIQEDLGNDGTRSSRRTTISCANWRRKSICRSPI